MLILPAIDLRGGQCVRLTQGDYTQEKVYDSDPIRVAQVFAEHGAHYIHVVDLDGAKGGSPQNWDAIRGIVEGVSVPVELGGGIRTAETARKVLATGVSRVIVGTKLVEDQALAKSMFEEFGEQVVAGIDARNGMVATGGWIDQSAISAVELALRMEDLGARRIILTDIAQDGMLIGPNLDLLRSVSSAVRIPIIHSGGIGTLDHIRALYDAGKARPEGVITGRAIYEGKFSVREAVTLAASFSTTGRIV